LARAVAESCRWCWAEWQRTIGTLLQSEPQLSIQANWLGEYYPLELETLEYCLGVDGLF